jgi:hypothetical protein
MADRLQSRTKKAKRGLSGVVACAMLVVFFYGAIRFSDGPIHQCAEHGFCGKQQQPHSLADYQAFITWQDTLFIIWPIGMVLLILLSVRDWQAKLDERREASRRER